MKYAIAALALAGAVAAQVDAIPECAKTCIDNAIVAGGCAETDYACACANMNAIQADAAPCVAGNCSASDLTKTLAAVQEVCANLPASSSPAEEQPTETAGPTETASDNGSGYPTESQAETTAYPTETAYSSQSLVTSTIYQTTVRTVTSCAPTVTNCPAHSTVLTTETIAVSTTVCPATEVPSYPAETPSYPAETPSYPAQAPTYPAETPSYPAEIPSVTTSYVGTGTGYVPSKTASYSQIQVTAGAAAVGSMGGVAALVLAAMAL